MGMVSLQIWVLKGQSLSQASALISEHGRWRIQGSDGHLDSLGSGVQSWPSFLVLVPNVGRACSEL